MSTIEEAREQAREALARHESQSANSPFHFGLDDHMYIALRALLDATEPPAQAEPAEDEREALAKTLYLWDTDEDLSRQSWDDLLDTQQDVWRSGADAIFAAGYSKGPRPITEEMVKAAAAALPCTWRMPDDAHPTGKLCRHSGQCLDRARHALEAAEEARR